MSFDLLVFRPASALTAADARALYLGLCGDKSARRAALRSLERAKDCDRFYDALIRTHPELDDDEERSPFTSALERLEGAVIMNLSFSRAAEVHALVERLAKAHGLHCFDPQSGKLFDPRSDTPRQDPEAKLKPAAGLERFVASATPLLAQRGFAWDVRGKVWTRALPNGVLHQVSLNQGTRELRPSVSVGTGELVPLLAPFMGKGEPLPSMGLEYLYFMGLIPRQPWSEPGRASFNHEICHAGCVDKSVRVFGRELVRFALPLFDELDTLGAVDRFFLRTKSPVSARKNWELRLEARAGPARRFWRGDRALLLVTAIAALARPGERKATFAQAKGRARQWARAGLHDASKALVTQLDALQAALDSTTPR